MCELLNLEDVARGEEPDLGLPLADWIASLHLIDLANLYLCIWPIILLYQQHRGKQEVDEQEVDEQEVDELGLRYSLS